MNCTEKFIKLVISKNKEKVIYILYLFKGLQELNQYVKYNDQKDVILN